MIENLKEIEKAESGTDMSIIFSSQHKYISKKYRMLASQCHNISSAMAHSHIYLLHKQLD